MQGILCSLLYHNYTIMYYLHVHVVQHVGTLLNFHSVEKPLKPLKKKLVINVTRFPFLNIINIALCYIFNYCNTLFLLPTYYISLNAHNKCELCQLLVATVRMLVSTEVADATEVSYRTEAVAWIHQTLASLKIKKNHN